MKTDSRLIIQQILLDSNAFVLYDYPRKSLIV